MRQTGVAFALTALALAVSARPTSGQTISFFRQFNAPGMGAVAADASGIYVIGNSVRKYDSRGNELWTREFSAGALTADPTGVYVVGSSGFRQLVLRKYSASGNELWTRRLESLGPVSVAVDASGVYMAAGDFPNPSFLRKYSLEGAELWITRIGEPPALDYVQSVAVDGTSVYVVGIARTYGQFSFLRKYDTRGNELWTRQLDSNTLVVSSKAVAADATGVYVITGQGASPDFPGFTFGRQAVRKYDAAGNELWTRQFATSYAVSPTALAADATGVYVSGATFLDKEQGAAPPVLPGQCRSGSGGDAFVRKYDPDGVELWTREFGASEFAGAAGVAVDSSGVYVVGEYGTRVPYAFFPSSPTIGAFLAKFEKTAAAAGSGPRIFSDCVVNAASYVGGGVAPGEIVTIFGAAMGPSELVPYRLTEDRSLATELAGARILFNGVPAPLLYVSDKQSSAIVPYAVADRTSVDVQVEYRSVRSEPVTLPVLASRPGIFSLDASGQGQGAILNEDGSLNSLSNPAQRGSVITIFGTGGGEAAPGVVDGQIVSGIIPRASLPVSVFFDVDGEWGVPSKPGDVLYAGGSPGSVAGLLQINVRVPANAALTGGAVPFALIIGSHWTVFQSTIALR